MVMIIRRAHLIHQSQGTPTKPPGPGIILHRTAKPNSSLKPRNNFNDVLQTRNRSKDVGRLNWKLGI